LATVVKKPKNAKKPWAVRYQVAGKQRERSFTTKKEADGYKAKYEYENRQHIFTDPKAGASFVEAAEAYIDRLDCAANTRRGPRYSSTSASTAPRTAGTCSLTSGTTSLPNR
jgi:hypothetical protein